MEMQYDPQLVREELLSAAERAQKFGERKSFISSVYEYMPLEYQEEASLEDFKLDLLEWQKLGLVGLARADMPQVMDRGLVRDSEISVYEDGKKYPIMSVHFVDISSLKGKLRRNARDFLPGGLADKGPPPNLDPEQLRMGIKVEMEHTNDRRIAREIALDHLTEDPEYYTYLERMEEKRKRDLQRNGSVKVTKANRKEVIAQLLRAGVPGVSKTSTTSEVRAVVERLERAGRPLGGAPPDSRGGRYVGQREYRPREHDFDRRSRYDD